MKTILKTLFIILCITFTLATLCFCKNNEPAPDGDEIGDGEKENGKEDVEGGEEGGNKEEGDEDKEDPNEPSDEEPADDTEEIRAAIDGANLIISSAKDRYPKQTEPSLDTLIPGGEDFSFSISGFSGGDGSFSPSDSVTFIDKTLYIRANETDGVSSTPISYIMKLYDMGALTVTTQNGQTTSSLTSDSGINGDLLKELLDVLDMSAEGARTTGVENKYRLSSASSQRIEEAMLELLSLDEDDFSIEYTVLDVGGLESDGVISVMIALKYSDTRIYIAVKAPEKANGEQTVGMSLIFGGLSINTEYTVSDNGSYSSSSEIVSGVTKTTLKAVLTKDENEDNAYRADVEYVMNVNAHVTRIFALADLTTDDDGTVLTLKGDVGYESSDEIAAVATVDYDKSKLETVGETPLSVILWLAERGYTKENILLTLTTVRYDEVKEYEIKAESREGNTETLTASLVSPAVKAPTLTDEELMYVERADLYLSDLDASLERADEINEELKERIENGQKFTHSCGYYTADEESGLVFITDITVEKNKVISVTTEFVINYEDFLYYYRENDGSFSESARSRSELDAKALSEAVTTDLPEGFHIKNNAPYWTYTYVEDYGLYVAILGNDENSALFFYYEPIDVTINGLMTHKLIYDDSGAPAPHSFTESYSSDCKLIYTCSYCEYSIEADVPTHNYFVDERVYDGNTLCRTLYCCNRCKSGALTVYDESGCSFELSVVISDKATSPEGGGDAKYSLTVNDIKHVGRDGCTGHDRFELPAIAESSACRITAFYRSNNNTYYSCTGVDTLVLSDEITSIGQYAFYGATHKRIILTDSVQSIGESAFANCKALTEITVPCSVEEIGPHAFDRCTALERLELSDGLVSVGNDAFYGCTSLECVSLPKSVSTLGARAFEGCTSLTTATLYGEVGTNAFLNCTSLTTLTVCGSIGAKAFYGCTALTTITVSGNIGESAFRRCTALSTVNLLDGEEYTIGRYAFSGCISLRTLSIPSSVAAIEYSAFNECKALEELTLAAGIAVIDERAFNECSSLKRVTIPGTVKSLPPYVFSYCSSLEEVILSEGITDVNTAFDYCDALKSITLPKSIERMYPLACFTHDSLESIYYNGTLEDWCAIEFASEERSNPLCYGAGLYCEGVLLTEIVLPESVTILSDYLFCGYSRLTSVVIPEGVTVIGKWAFKDCTSLEKVVLPKSLEKISQKAFNGCSALTEIDLSGVGRIESYAFENCTSLSGTLVLKDLDFGSFEGCTGITEVILLDGILGISKSAFEGCKALEKIVIPESLLGIREDAFFGCPSLRDVYYSGNSEKWKTVTVNSRGNEAFISANLHYGYVYEE